MIPKLGLYHEYDTRNRKMAIQTQSLDLFWKKPSAAGINFFYKAPQKIPSLSDSNSFKTLKNTGLVRHITLTKFLYE